MSNRLTDGYVREIATDYEDVVVRQLADELLELRARVAEQEAERIASVDVVDQVSGYGGDERQRISRLLRQAAEMIDRAYGLSQKQAVEKPRLRPGSEAGA